LAFYSLGLVFLPICRAENIYTSIAFLSLTIFGADMTVSPSWSYCMDVGKNHVGVLLGTLNIASNL
jgi:ACS family glucarate transporter-like MFS transporter